MGVDGAKSMGTGLLNNDTLEVLDIGCNRIRNKGVKAIIQGILGTESKSIIKILGLKNNFINDKGFKEVMLLIKQKCGPLANK